jgi:hypothetical protein
MRITIILFFASSRWGLVDKLQQVNQTLHTQKSKQAELWNELQKIKQIAFKE